MVTQRIVKTRKAENFIRSANPPMTMAGVIIANMPWKTINVWCGIASEYGPASVALTPASPSHSRLPTRPPIDGPKARL